MEITPQNTDEAILKELGSRLRRARLDRNLSQADLAAEAGLGRVTVQRIEEGKLGTVAGLVRVLRALDLIEGLDLLAPEPSPSPLEELKRRGGQRQRAGRPADAAERPQPGRPWRWGDEEDGVER